MIKMYDCLLQYERYCTRTFVQQIKIHLICFPLKRIFVLIYLSGNKGQICCCTVIFFSLSGLTESLGMLFKLDVIFLTRTRKGQEGVSTFRSFAFFSSGVCWVLYFLTQ